jgi:hypothetical protein
MFSCRQCTGSDPTTDTVKINIPPVERPVEEDQEARRRAEEEAEAERRRQEAADHAEAERLQQEEAERLRAEEDQAAEARRRECEAKEAARQQQLREEAERAEAEEQQRQEEARRHRQAKVSAFLKAQGFKSVTAPKRSMMKTTYPIILAAEAGDTEMVGFLIQEGADAARKNSSGKTAQEAAMKKNKKSSHDGVLRALGGA